MAGSKRSLDSAEASSIATSLSPDDVRAACIYRQLLCEACGLPSFSKLVRFCFVRVVVNPKEGPVLLPIIGLGRPLLKPYALPGLSASTRNTLRLALGRASKRPHVDIKVAQASNSLPSLHELQAAAQSSVLAEMRWEKDAVRRAAIERERIVRDARSGRSSEVDGTVWGSSTLHKSAVLFRSWVAEPGLVYGSAKRWQAQLDGGDAVGPAKESSAEADYFKVCLAEMAPSGFNFGTGPSRWREKWRGEFSFLMYYRAHGPGAGGDARVVLETPCLPAHNVYDEAQPEITAWRVVRKVVGDHVSLAAFRNSIVCHYDCQLGSNGTAVDGSAAASSASAAGAIRPAYTVHEPPSTKAGSTRSFRGCYYLFVVDADTMARQTASTMVPGSTTESRTAHQQALDRLCPNSSSPGVLGLGALHSMASGEGAGPRSASSSQREPAAKHRRVEPSSAVLEWVSESDLRRLVPPDTLDILGSRGKILAAYGTDPTGSKSSSSASAGSAETSESKGTGSGSGSAAADAPSRIGGDFSRALQLLRGDHADSVGKFLPCRRGCVVRLYHGTKLSLARQLHKEGFRRPMCRNLPACRGEIPPRDAGGPCRCQMEGFGVYFGRKDKAMKFATRRAEFDKERGCNVGAVIVADVDLGYCKPALPEPCPCGCGLKYVDHLGSWYSRDGYDALYVSDDSMPASATAEWCVADPARINIVRVEEVVTAEAASGDSGIAQTTASEARTGGTDGGPSSSPSLDYDAVMRGGAVSSVS